MLRYRKPYNTRHSYATMMLMAGITPAFCAAQLGHSVGMLMGTYARWLDGAHNALEMQRLEAALDRDSSPNLSQETASRHVGKWHAPHEEASRSRAWSDG